MKVPGPVMERINELANGKKCRAELTVHLNLSPEPHRAGYALKVGKKTVGFLVRQGQHIEVQEPGDGRWWHFEAKGADKSWQQTASHEDGFGGEDAQGETS